MTAVTIPKIEYEILKNKAKNYENIHKAMEKDIFSTPPTRKISEVISGFKKTKRYNKAFLKSLKTGLKRSFHFRS